MSIYAIGDIHACYDELRRLLDSLNFDLGSDHLWLVGDLVNRGPKSLETLRFIKTLGDAAISVLGNHDLHLLATHAGVRDLAPGSSLHGVLRAPDCEELIHWLRHRPVMHSDSTMELAMVHAGIPPQWDLATACRLAQELEETLRGDDYQRFLRHMYGNRPDTWSDDLRGWDRLRVITNGFTRLRYCEPSGRMNMSVYAPPGTQPQGLVPWFEVPNRKTTDMTIVCGHWAALGYRRQAGLLALDSGCVWGGRLSAVRLDHEEDVITTVFCPSYAKQ